ncbi:MAG: hypothetical protein V4438_03350 [Patescibacteria group bacterium]
MSLADFYNKVNSSGANLYSEKRGQIIREAASHSSFEEKRTADKEAQEVAHLRLHKENITGQIQQVKKDIAMGRGAGYTPSLIAEKEKMLHKLENDHLHLKSEILKAGGMNSAASRIRFNNPHYF